MLGSSPHETGDANTLCLNMLFIKDFYVGKIHISWRLYFSLHAHLDFLMFRSKKSNNWRLDGLGQCCRAQSWRTMLLDSVHLKRSTGSRQNLWLCLDLNSSNVCYTSQVSLSIKLFGFEHCSISIYLAITLVHISSYFASHLHALNSCLCFLYFPSQRYHNDF
jgi:hypothetical protein